MRTKVVYVILLLILLSLLLKLYPPLSHDFLVNFDSIYHSRIGQYVAENGWVPATDPVMGGRPHLYPPGYHLTLGYASVLSGIPVLALVSYLLPLISALLVIPAFWLISKHYSTCLALWGAAFMAFNPIVMAQSFDSPQLFGLLLLPLIAYSLFKGRYLYGGGLFALCIFFNYFVSFTIAAVLVIFGVVKFMKGEKRSLIYSLLIIIIGAGLISPWLLLGMAKSGECLDPSTAVSSITNEGVGYLLVMMPFLLLIGFGVLYWIRNREGDYVLFWRIAFALGVVAFLVSLALPQLHPYDQLLLFGFSLVFILPELNLSNKRYALILGIMIFASILAVVDVEPALDNDDLAAVRWVGSNVHNATILANPEVSGTINTLAPENKIRTEFGLFLECIPDSERWESMYWALETEDSSEASDILDKYDVDYVVVGARDVWNYDFAIEKFEDMGKAIYVSGETKVYRIR
jgi:hypothetical protein